MKLEISPQSTPDDTINIILPGKVSALVKTSPNILLNALLGEIYSIPVSSTLFLNVQNKFK